MNKIKNPGGFFKVFTVDDMHEDVLFRFKNRESEKSFQKRCATNRVNIITVAVSEETKRTIKEWISLP